MGEVYILVQMNMENYDVEPFLLRPPVLDLLLLFRELFIPEPHLLSPGQVGFSSQLGPWSN